MEALAWLLFAAVLAYYAFRSDSGDTNKNNVYRDDRSDNDDDDDDFLDPLGTFVMMDYMSDGEIDGNFSDEY